MGSGKSSQTGALSDGPLEAVLVTGRRGPYPLYRLNGVYGLDSKQVATAAGATKPPSGEGAEGQAWRYTRIDRKEVSLSVARAAGAGQDQECLTWECRLDDSAKLAHGTQRSGDSTSVEGWEPTGEWEIDNNVVIMTYMPPDTQDAGEGAPPLTQHRGIARLSGLPCPCAGFVPGDGKKMRRYSVWGNPGDPDSLLDMLQGEIGNCGVLAAIDALAYPDPQAFVGHSLSAGTSVEDAVAARLYDPLCGKLYEWSLDAEQGGSVQKQQLEESASARPASLHVIGNTSVPKYVRSMTSRAWAMLLEQALADLAGGYPRLDRCEPGVVWQAILELRAMPKRWGRFPGSATWSCAVANVDCSGKVEPPPTICSYLCACLPGRRASRPGKLIQKRAPSTDELAGILGRRHDFAVEVSPGKQQETGSPIDLDSGAMPLPSDKGERCRTWHRARHWKVPRNAPCVSDYDFEVLLEALAKGSVPVCIFPVGKRQGTKEAGEPCVDMEVCYLDSLESAEQHSSAASEKSAGLEKIRFVIGHAYSMRDAWRSESSDDLWIRLRDPRRARLFWARWRDVLVAGEHICFVYTCSWTPSSSARDE